MPDAPARGPASEDGQQGRFGAISAQAPVCASPSAPALPLPAPLCVLDVDVHTTAVSHPVGSLLSPPAAADHAVVAAGAPLPPAARREQEHGNEVRAVLCLDSLAPLMFVRCAPAAASTRRVPSSVARSGRAGR